MLILDNVDDAGFLLRTDSRGQERQTNNEGTLPLVSYLPQCQHGSILVTTRSRDAALQLVEQRNIISINPMSEIDAIILLEKKLDQQDDPDNAAALAGALEYMPLAIVQAAAYISRRAPRCSVLQYVEELQKGDWKRASLLNFEGGQLRRDGEAKNSIIITWQISFDHIRQTRPSAADLLSLMSFFDRQGIPESLLRRRQKTADNQPFNKETNIDDYQNGANDNDSSTDDERSTNSDDVLEDDISTLRDYSFISVTATEASLEMHSLVQLATRKWLEMYGYQERWKQQFIRNLDAEFPTGEYKNWARCQPLFPHVKSATAQKPEGQDSLIEWASLMYRAAWYSLEIGNWPDAETMSMQSMRVRKKKLGADHPDTLSSMANLAATYWNQGRWDAAEELEVQVMEMRKKKLGADHPDTLSSMANLVATYRNQGRWDGAEELEVQVMEMRKKKLGADHPDTLTSMANLATTYRNQGRWDAAEELDVQVMEMSKKKLGADHPDTLSSMANLAATYRNQGRWDAAEELEVQVMEMRKKKLGADHPNTLTSMANLAATYWNQGRWDTAEELEVQVMEMRKKKLGADHPDTLSSMANLAATYRNQGRWDTAEELEVCK